MQALLSLGKMIIIAGGKSISEFLYIIYKFLFSPCCLPFQHIRSGFFLFFLFFFSSATTLAPVYLFRICFLVIFVKSASN